MLNILIVLHFDQVLRHLRAIIPWHAAASSLLGTKYRHITQTLRVGLVEVVAPSQPNLMTDEEVIQEFLRRQPASSPEARISSRRSDPYGAFYIFLPWLTFRQSWGPD